MALAPVAKKQYPAVPKAPGVPPMVRLFQVLDAITVLAADATLLAKSFRGPSWGIFSQFGVPVIVGDSVISFDYRNESRISDYPVEDGGFASYNKVANPADVRLSFAFAGNVGVFTSLASGGALGAIFTGKDLSQSARHTYLQDLEDASNTLNLYTVITPEYSYPSCNIIHYDYRRDAKNGATLIVVDVWLQEVRVTATAQFTTPTAPSGSDAISNGGVQATTPSPGQAATIQTTAFA